MILNILLNVGKSIGSAAARVIELGTETRRLRNDLAVRYPYSLND